MAKTLGNINSTIINLEGKEIKDDNQLPVQVNRVVANVLTQSRSSDAIRAIVIAQELYKAENSITLEDADYKLVIDAINEAKLSNLIKATVLKVFQPENT